ncbi:MAG: hypothetical protein BIP78_0108 [Candidatus Bipolaricaulis sibiricus]|uniref:Methyltransferase type 12 domain-containing protein n=1 Tax=Bipolaricaulis sibiricus TaxID=2501609 RepID=A0A410FS89_BIPS1|nr:MAG: hypothetical protein BIP78_0108 [Candidatus Bipolaricaulis sibiricus]
MDREAQRQAEEWNRRLWDEMAHVHVRAYREVDLLRTSQEVLDEIELREVGDVRGKRLLHLQCHIGTDTLAWARHGAIVTGVDFSGESIRCAEALREELGLEARFIQSNVYDLPDVLSEEFDLVYTSRGVLCWLRDLNAWAGIIARFLAPDGIFYLMESHPILHALEERPTGEIAFIHPYFHRREPVRWEAGGHDYADPTYRLQHPSHEWIWSMSDVVNAVLRAGLRLEFLNEYDRLFFPFLPSMTSADRRWYRLPLYENKIPLLWTLRARKEP